MNVCLHSFVPWGLLQAACLHNILHPGGPLLDDSVRVITIALPLVKLFLELGIGFGFGFFSIRTAMVGPVIAIGFRPRREAGRWKSRLLLLMILPVTRHGQTSATRNQNLNRRINAFCASVK